MLTFALAGRLRGPIGTACLGAWIAALLWSTASVPADVFTNPEIPAAETGPLVLLYQKDIPVNSPGWNSGPVPYEVNNAASITQPVERVAYYWELQKASGPPDWVYVSMAPFTADLGKLGIPNVASGALFRQYLSDMNVYSNVAGIVEGVGIATGSIEFWPSNYGQNNDLGIPGASNTLFDFGDGGASSSAGHGCMQIHNWGAGQTLFAYNAWGAARTSELGLGNQVGGSGQPDWTFNTINISSYTSRTLQVLVVIPEPASAVLLALGWLARGRRRH